MPCDLFYYISERDIFERKFSRLHYTRKIPIICHKYKFISKLSNQLVNTEEKNKRWLPDFQLGHGYTYTKIF